MIGDLHYCQCTRCNEPLHDPEWGSETDMINNNGYRKTSLYGNHSEAICAMEAAGWRIGSESIGGDVCKACVEAEQIKTSR